MFLNEACQVEPGVGRSLGGRHDAFCGHRYPANAEAFRGPCVARVRRTIGPCSDVENVHGTRARREEARRPSGQSADMNVSAN